MSDADKISAIINAIQSDAQLIILLRTVVTNNLMNNNVPSQTLDAAMHVLGLS